MGWKNGVSAGAMLLLVGLAVGSSDSGSSRSGSSTQPAAAAGDTKRITGSHWYGCMQRDYFEKLTGYAVQKDAEAFKQALAAGIVAGTCIMFQEGDAVYIADTAIFSGLVKVRPKGKTAEYWTNLEAVK